MSVEPEYTPDDPREGEVPVERLRDIFRICVFVIGAGQILVAVAMVAGAVIGGSDAAGNGMMAGFAMVAVLVVLAFGVPALLLAYNRKHLKTALILSLVFPVGWLYMTSL